jgi:hypothetical protein
MTDTVELVIFWKAGDHTGIMASAKGRAAFEALVLDAVHKPMPWTTPPGGFPDWKGVSHAGLSREEVDALVADLAKRDVCAVVQLDTDALTVH